MMVADMKGTPDPDLTIALNSLRGARFPVVRDC